MLESQRLGRLGWLCILLILMVVALLVAVITLGIRVNSKACKDGLLAEQECCNATRLLELRLTQTQQDLLETMDQAATCNQTAVSDCNSPRGPCACMAATGLDRDGGRP